MKAADGVFRQRTIATTVEGTIQEKTEEPISYRQAQYDNHTCFFWYHGDCLNKQDKKGFTCHYRHALTDPPAMVQPPPKYIHRQPCGLEWCPGDAKASSDTLQRYYVGDPNEDFEHAASTGVHDKSGVDEVEGNADAVSEGDGTEEPWFLSGFE